MHAGRRLCASWLAGRPAVWPTSPPEGEWLSAHLGQPLVIENRVGAATNIATETVIRAQADINHGAYSRLTLNVGVYDQPDIVELRSGQNSLSLTCD